MEEVECAPTPQLEQDAVHVSLGCLRRLPAWRWRVGGARARLLRGRVQQVHILEHLRPERSVGPGCSELCAQALGNLRK